jgi:hypothetical protein
MVPLFHKTRLAATAIAVLLLATCLRPLLRTRNLVLALTTP